MPGGLTLAPLRQTVFPGPRRCLPSMLEVWLAFEIPRSNAGRPRSLRSLLARRGGLSHVTWPWLPCRLPYGAGVNRAASLSHAAARHCSGFRASSGSGTTLSGHSHRRKNSPDVSISSARGDTSTKSWRRAGQEPVPVGNTSPTGPTISSAPSNRSPTELEVPSYGNSADSA